MQVLKAIGVSFLDQRERWILWVPVAIAAGIGGYFSLQVEPPLWLGFLFLGFLTAGIAPFYKNKAAVLLWLPLFLVVLGFTAAQVRTAMVAAPMLSYKTYPLMIEGRVVHMDALPKQASRVVMDQLIYDTSKKLPQDNMPERVRVKLKNGTVPPHTGDIIRVKAMLLPLPPMTAPGAYDFQRHAFYSRLGATGFAISDVEVVKAKEGGFFFPALRRYLREHIKAGMDNPDAAAITIALLDGEEQDISKETMDVIRAAGIAHLIAISGLQVTLVTGFFFFVVRAFLASIPYIALRYPIKKITAFIAMCGAVFYMMLIGESVSAERSVIMMCVVMIALMLDRDPFTLRVAAFAAAAMLLIQPEVLFGASFQMSFGAVVALIAFYEATRDWWSKGYEDRRWYGKVGIYIGGSLATTLIATLATASFALYHFLRTPLFPGLIENLIAVPLSSFVTMPAAITASFLMPLGLEKLPLMLAEWSVVVIIESARIVAQWPYAQYHVDAWPMWILVMICLGGLWVCIWQKKMRWLGLIPVAVGFLLIPGMPRADVMVSESGKIFAVRGDDGRLWISSEKAEKFIRNSWIEREGGEGHGFWGEEGSPVTCDDEACIYQLQGKTISFVKNYAALQRDCTQGAIIISPLYIAPNTCEAATTVIDKYKLKHKGAHMLYFEGNDRIVSRAVYSERGQRAWSLRQRSKVKRQPVTETKTVHGMDMQ